VDPDSKRLLVSVSDGAGRAVRDGGLARWLAAVAPARLKGEVSIALVSDARMRTLNRTYRHKDKVTDVLSFGASAEPRAARREPRAAILGDIVIATGVARRQAGDVGHSYQSELRVLALHGLLHLLGYDHHHAADDGRMGRLEMSLRKKGGLTRGLIERTSPGRKAGRASR
jgi:probable rRNA maturation factor